MSNSFYTITTWEPTCDPMRSPKPDDIYVPCCVCLWPDWDSVPWGPCINGTSIKRRIGYSSLEGCTPSVWPCIEEQSHECCMVTPGPFTCDYYDSDGDLIGTIAADINNIYTEDPSISQNAEFVDCYIEYIWNMSECYNYSPIVPQPGGLVTPTGGTTSGGGVGSFIPSQGQTISHQGSSIGSLPHSEHSWPRGQPKPGSSNPGPRCYWKVMLEPWECYLPGVNQQRRWRWYELSEPGCTPTAMGSFGLFEVQRPIDEWEYQTACCYGNWIEHSDDYCHFATQHYKREHTYTFDGCPPQPQPVEYWEDIDVPCCTWIKRDILLHNCVCHFDYSVTLEYEDSTRYETITHWDFQNEEYVQEFLDHVYVNNNMSYVHFDRNSVRISDNTVGSSLLWMRFECSRQYDFLHMIIDYFGNSMEGSGFMWYGIDINNDIYIADCVGSDLANPFFPVPCDDMSFNTLDTDIKIKDIYRIKSNAPLKYFDLMFVSTKNAVDDENDTRIDEHYLYKLHIKEQCDPRDHVFHPTGENYNREPVDRLVNTCCDVWKLGDEHVGPCIDGIRRTTRDVFYEFCLPIEPVPWSTEILEQCCEWVPNTIVDPCELYDINDVRIDWSQQPPHIRPPIYLYMERKKWTTTQVTPNDPPLEWLDFSTSPFWVKCPKIVSPLPSVLNIVSVFDVQCNDTMCGCDSGMYSPWHRSVYKTIGPLDDNFHCHHGKCYCLTNGHEVYSYEHHDELLTDAYYRSNSSIVPSTRTSIGIRPHIYEKMTGYWKNDPLYVDIENNPLKSYDDYVRNGPTEFGFAEDVLYEDGTFTNMKASGSLQVFLRDGTHIIGFSPTAILPDGARNPWHDCNVFENIHQTHEPPRIDFTNTTIINNKLIKKKFGFWEDATYKDGLLVDTSTLRYNMFDLPRPKLYQEFDFFGTRMYYERSFHEGIDGSLSTILADIFKVNNNVDFTLFPDMWGPETHDRRRYEVIGFVDNSNDPDPFYITGLPEPVIMFFIGNEGLQHQYSKNTWKGSQWGRVSYPPSSVLAPKCPPALIERDTLRPPIMDMLYDCTPKEKVWDHTFIVQPSDSINDFNHINCTPDECFGDGDTTTPCWSKYKKTISLRDLSQAPRSSVKCQWDCPTPPTVMDPIGPTFISIENKPTNLTGVCATTYNATYIDSGTQLECNGTVLWSANAHTKSAGMPCSHTSPGPSPSCSPTKCTCPDGTIAWERPAEYSNGSNIWEILPPGSTISKTSGFVAIVFPAGLSNIKFSIDEIGQDDTLAIFKKNGDQIIGIQFDDDSGASSTVAPNNLWGYGSKRFENLFESTEIAPGGLYSITTQSEMNSYIISETTFFHFNPSASYSNSCNNITRNMVNGWIDTKNSSGVTIKHTRSASSSASPGGRSLETVTLSGVLSEDLIMFVLGNGSYKVTEVDYNYDSFPGIFAPPGLTCPDETTGGTWVCSPSSTTNKLSCVCAIPGAPTQTINSDPYTGPMTCSEDLDATCPDELKCICPDGSVYWECPFVGNEDLRQQCEESVWIEAPESKTGDIVCRYGRCICDQSEQIVWEAEVSLVTDEEVYTTCSGGKCYCPDNEQVLWQSGPIPYPNATIDNIEGTIVYPNTFPDKVECKPLIKYPTNEDIRGRCSGGYCFCPTSPQGDLILVWPPLFTKIANLDFNIHPKRNINRFTVKEEMPMTVNDGRLEFCGDQSFIKTNEFEFDMSGNAQHGKLYIDYHGTDMKDSGYFWYIKTESGTMELVDCIGDAHLYPYFPATCPFTYTGRNTIDVGWSAGGASIILDSDEKIKSLHMVFVHRNTSPTVPALSSLKVLTLYENEFPFVLFGNNTHPYGFVQGEDLYPFTFNDRGICPPYPYEYEYPDDLFTRSCNYFENFTYTYIEEDPTCDSGWNCHCSETLRYTWYDRDLKMEIEDSEVSCINGACFCPTGNMELLWIESYPNEPIPSTFLNKDICTPWYISPPDPTHYRHWCRTTVIEQPDPINPFLEEAVNSIIGAGCSIEAFQFKPLDKQTMLSSCAKVFDCYPSEPQPEPMTEVLFQECCPGVEWELDDNFTPEVCSNTFNVVRWLVKDHEYESTGECTPEGPKPPVVPIFVYCCNDDFKNYTVYKNAWNRKIINFDCDPSLENCMACIASSDASQPQMVYSDDGAGNVWVELPRISESLQFVDLAHIKDSRWIAVTSNTVWETADAGNTWSDISSVVLLPIQDKGNLRIDSVDSNKDFGVVCITTSRTDQDDYHHQGVSDSSTPYLLFSGKNFDTNSWIKYETTYFRKTRVISAKTSTPIAGFSVTNNNTQTYFLQWGEGVFKKPSALTNTQGAFEVFYTIGYAGSVQRQVEDPFNNWQNLPSSVLTEVPTSGTTTRPIFTDGVITGYAIGKREMRFEVDYNEQKMKQDSTWSISVVGGRYKYDGKWVGFIACSTSNIDPSELYSNRKLPALTFMDYQDAWTPCIVLKNEYVLTTTYAANLVLSSGHAQENKNRGTEPNEIYPPILDVIYNEEMGVFWAIGEEKTLFVSINGLFWAVCYKYPKQPTSIIANHKDYVLIGTEDGSIDQVYLINKDDGVNPVDNIPSFEPPFISGWNYAES